MYTEFYGFREPPFQQTPNPSFLYLGAAHREALAQLEYGLRTRCGFLALTGEVGTGKTTLLQELLRRLPAETATARVVHGRLEFDDILRYLLADLGVDGAGDSRAERLIALNRFLIERRRRDADTILVFDEAQNLSRDALEQIRLLSNFETATDKLLQIVLVGQPELAEQLARPELRQLRQRISIRSAIEPLAAEESIEYVRHRLAVARGTKPAGAGDPPAGIAPFSARALRHVARRAGGIPRVLNLVCDHCLVLGYAEQRREIDGRTAKAALAYVERDQGRGAFAAGAGGRVWRRIFG